MLPIGSNPFRFVSNALFYTRENLPFYLHIAIQEKDDGLVKSLCNKGISVEGMEYEGKPLLEIAIDQYELGDTKVSQIVESLIRAGADPKGITWIDPNKEIWEEQEKKSLLFIVIQNYLISEHEPSRGIYRGLIDRNKEEKIIELLEIFHQKGVELNEIIYKSPYDSHFWIYLISLADTSLCFQLTKKLFELSSDLETTCGKKYFLNHLWNVIKKDQNKEKVLQEFISWGVPPTELAKAVFRAPEEFENISQETQLDYFKLLIPQKLDVINFFFDPFKNAFRKEGYRYPLNLLESKALVVYARAKATDQIFPILCARKYQKQGLLPIFKDLPIELIKRVFQTLIKLHTQQVESDLNKRALPTS